VRCSACAAIWISASNGSGSEMLFAPSMAGPVAVPFVGNYRTFLMTPGMPDFAEFSKLCA
jgi:hypothetical protein